MAEKRLYSGERDAMNELAVIVKLVPEITEELGERIGMVKYGKRNLGMLKYTVNALVEGIVKTIPSKQLEAVTRNLADSALTIGVRAVNKQGHNDEWGLWVSNDNMEVITNAAQSKCLTCDLKDGRERECPLRKALDEIGTDVNHEAKGCGYMWL